MSIEKLITISETVRKTFSHLMVLKLQKLLITISDCVSLQIKDGRRCTTLFRDGFLHENVVLFTEWTSLCLLSWARSCVVGKLEYKISINEQDGNVETIIMVGEQTNSLTQSEGINNPTPRRWPFNICTKNWLYLPL